MECMESDRGSPGSRRKTVTDLGSSGNVKMKEIGNECRVPGSGRRKQGKSVGFVCEWRGFVWLREERVRGPGLNLGFTRCCTKSYNETLE